MSDRESIDEKIERLEAEQRDLRETVRKMLPNRRQFIKGAATAAGAGAVGFSAGTASAQASSSDSDGDIGTSSDRVDLFADGVDVGTEVVGAGTIGTSSNRMDIYGATVDSNSVTTDRADITGETYVEAYRNTAVTGVAAGNWTNILDTEVDDTLGELDSNFAFSPSETGIYRIYAKAQYDIASSGDRIDLRVYNTTDSVVENNVRNISASSDYYHVSIANVMKLDSSKSYVIQGRDVDSTYDIEAGQNNTRVEIVREVVHP